MIVSDILLHHASQRPGALALVCGNRRYDQAALRMRVRRLASALLGLGLRSGDRVGLLATNRAEHVETVLALSMIGAVWVPLNFRLTAGELAYIVDDAQCVALVYSEDLGRTAADLADAAPRIKHWIGIGGTGRGGHAYEALLARGQDRAADAAPTSDDLFAVMYTSGTTGRPKGAMLSHRQILHGAMCNAFTSGARPDDVTLQVIPQFHAGGNLSQLSQMLVGSPIVIAPRFEPELVLRLIAAERISFICFVPAMLTFLLETPALATAAVGSVTRLMYGGSAIAPDRLARAMQVFGADFQQVYGQTEAGVFATLLNDADHRRGLTLGNEALLLSCGRAVIGYEVRIVDDSGSEAAVGAVGELACRGDAIMSGYWNMPEATRAALRHGWLHTGDMARLDAAGYFTIVDRKVDMIVSGGENVYPVEVENVISAHPAVLEVAVIGVPDETWGEAVKAIVVARPSARASADDIIAFCRGKLAGFKIPKSVDLAAALPRTPSGKIVKGELRKPYWHGRARKVN
ncbi:MAG: long-chain-fatty-acid--CoA ligase [Alphaproteobacteria bacterium]|nr:long-chain-fatty-acid--CoA ligase [Alphaproteobacteria bacterium]